MPPSVLRASWAGGEGGACMTSRGILGSCHSFRNCYPFFKKPTAKIPDLNSWDYWVLGNYDTCNYYLQDGRQAFGVCCTNPITPSPSLETEQNKVELPNRAPPVQSNNNFGSWPPPIPTHPPDHTAATHPPAYGIPPATTKKPFGIEITSRRTTTWATKPPSTQQSLTTSTTKKPLIVATTTTESPLSNDVVLSGSCGAKNGFLVRRILNILVLVFF